MTTLEAYENVLVELNKVEAPSLLLSDFNYFFMKSIFQYVNKGYNFYDMNQQVSDSTNPLKKIVTLPLKDNKAKLDEDYMHVLGCKVGFDVINHCNETNLVEVGAIRLTADARAQVESNYYMRPSLKRPYYILHNSAGQTEIEILSGNKDTYIANNVIVEYLKSPSQMILTEDQIEGLEDSQNMEFAEYACYEIIIELVKLIMENASDPRLQSYMPINQSIAPAVSTAGK